MSLNKFTKLKDKKHSYYVADSYNRYTPITLRDTRENAFEVANKLNGTKDINDILGFKNQRYCVLLADYKI